MIAATPPAAPPPAATPPAAPCPRPADTVCLPEGLRVPTPGEGAASGLLFGAVRRAAGEAISGSFAWANRERRASLVDGADGLEPAEFAGDFGEEPPVLPFEDWFTVQTRFVEAGRLEPIPPDPEEVALLEELHDLPDPPGLWDVPEIEGAAGIKGD